MAFNGLLDEATLFDYALSQTEIQADYEEITGIKLNAAGPRVDRLKVQVWNIWHGGHRFGEHVGVERTCEILKETNADIIGLIETYGSGAIIADSLGYYFYLVGTNLSIMSRYPIEETISVYEPFYSGGAIINLGEDQKIAFFDTWLWYQPGFPPISKWAEPETLHEFHEAEKRRVGEIENILKGIRPYVDNSDSIPVIMVGDFNSSSHLDHTEETAPLYGNIILDRPVSKLMINAGFKDSYRESHPSPAMNPGYTWSPLYNENGILKNEGRLSRIDYIYYQGEMLQPYHAVTLDYHPIFWPSDHASVITSFYLN
ncbi:MAG: endonuclease/exonuclease/phosphatase family protein [Sphingobacterium sp.]